MSKLLQLFVVLILYCCFAPSFLLSQDYLDSAHKYMKLTAVSSNKDYGYSMKQPIHVGSRVAMGAFLNSLIPLNADTLSVVALQDLGNKHPGLIKLQMTYKHHADTLSFYFKVNSFEQPLAPLGFRCKRLDELAAPFVKPGSIPPIDTATTPNPDAKPNAIH